MIQPFSLAPLPVSSGNLSLEETGTVPMVRSTEVTQYLLQQENPLSMFGQVVRSEAALDACPNHNDIADVFLSSHDAHLALQPQSPHTKERQAKRSSGLKEEE